MRHAYQLAVLALITLLTPLALSAKEWHVDPNGTADGDGSKAKPWSLQKAFSHPEGVKGGDTIWLHGGRYVGGFHSQLKGEPNSPILVRQAPGERATIDGNFNRTEKGNQSNVLLVNGQYAWFWGFELTSSWPNRYFEGDYGKVELPWGLDVGNSGENPGIKFINMIIHDTSQGPGVWLGAKENEVYGCLIYNNGYDAPDRAHGHGIYTQNKTGERFIIDNIIFNQYSHGVHAYGSSKTFFNNYRLRGNIAFGNGAASTTSSYTRDILIGGGNVAENPIIEDNYCYYTPPPVGFQNGTACELNYGQGSKDAVVRNNYFIAPAGGAFGLKAQGAKVEKNVMWGQVRGIAAADFPDNTYLTERPKGVQIFVRPNKYEPGRANICVFNWDNKETVAADVSKVLKSGDKYEVFDAQNFFGKPVASGTFDGKTIALPTKLTETAPVSGKGKGVREIPHTPQEFNAYVLFRR